MPHVISSQFEDLKNTDPKIYCIGLLFSAIMPVLARVFPYASKVPTPLLQGVLSGLRSLEVNKFFSDSGSGSGGFFIQSDRVGQLMTCVSKFTMSQKKKGNAMRANLMGTPIQSEWWLYWISCGNNRYSTLPWSFGWDLRVCKLTLHHQIHLLHLVKVYKLIQLVINDHLHYLELGHNMVEVKKKNKDWERSYLRIVETAIL